MFSLSLTEHSILYVLAVNNSSTLLTLIVTLLTLNHQVEHACVDST